MTELVGPSVDNVVADYVRGERLEPDIILKVTKQLLAVIDSLHQAGYAHGTHSLMFTMTPTCIKHPNYNPGFVSW